MCNHRLSAVRQPGPASTLADRIGLVKGHNIDNQEVASSVAPPTPAIAEVVSEVVGPLRQHIDQWQERVRLTLTPIAPRVPSVVPALLFDEAEICAKVIVLKMAVAVGAGSVVDYDSLRTGEGRDRLIQKLGRPVAEVAEVLEYHLDQRHSELLRDLCGS